MAGTKFEELQQKPGAQVQLLHPQVTVSDIDIDCQSCHMHVRKGFSKASLELGGNCPYTIVHVSANNTCYTQQACRFKNRTSQSA